MVYGEQLDPFAELKRTHEEYRVYDAHYESLGRADELFVDGDDRPLYIGIKAGLLEARSVLVPLEIIRVNDKRRVIEISGDADQVRHAPSLGDREEMTPDLEASIHNYFGLPSPLTHEREHRDISPEPVAEDRFAPNDRIDVEPGERQEAHERFEETPPRHTGRDEEPPDYLSGRSEPETPSRGPGKGWARGTEKIPSEGEAERPIRDPRTAGARRLRR
ncbi:MAG: hypothetical protein H0U04_05865 [Rubrobacter sp.]|nr:hypothetical protein [Rubrobacter sp.]